MPYSYNQETLKRYYDSQYIEQPEFAGASVGQRLKYIDGEWNNNLNGRVQLSRAYDVYVNNYDDNLEIVDTDFQVGDKIKIIDVSGSDIRLYTSSLLLYPGGQVINSNYHIFNASADGSYYPSITLMRVQDYGWIVIECCGSIGWADI